MTFHGIDAVNQLIRDKNVAVPTSAVCPIMCEQTCTWQKVREELAELHSILELSPTKIDYAYFARDLM